MRLGLVAAGVGRLFCWALGVCLLVYILDRALELPLAGRAWISATALACGAVLAARLVLRPVFLELPDHALVLELERRGVGPDGLLSAAVGLSRSPSASPMVAEVLERARLEGRRLRPMLMVRWRVPVAWGLAGMLAALALVCALAVAPRSAGICIERNLLLREVPWPKRTRFAVVSAPQYVVSGQEAEIRVRALGVAPRSVELRTRPVPTGEPVNVPMVREADDTFVATVGPLTRHTVFQVAGGDALSQERVIAVVDRPRVAEGRVVVTPPAYISDEEVELAWRAGTLEVPAGGTVRVVLTATSPLRSAVYRRDGGAVVEPEWLDAERRTLAVSLEVEEDAFLSVHLVDERGVRMAEPFRVNISAVPDDPPDVRLSAQGVGELVTPTATIPALVEVTDDYGVRAVRLLAGADGANREWQIGQGRGRRKLRAEASVSLPELPAEVGGRISLQGVAADTAAPDGPRFGRSTELTFRVVSTAELLNALLLVQLDLRRDLEDQARLQRSLRDDLYEEPAARDGLSARQAALAPVLEDIAGGYANVLDQMLNNRILEPATHSLRTAAIPGALRRLGGPAGAVTRAANALRAGGGLESAEAAMEEALAAMERIRASMLLIEGYSSIVASVKEVSDAQRKLLEQTETREDSLLQEVFGP